MAYWVSELLRIPGLWRNVDPASEAGRIIDDIMPLFSVYMFVYFQKTCFKLCYSISIDITILPLPQADSYNALLQLHRLRLPIF